jgi:hypothetical protein
LQAVKEQVQQHRIERDSQKHHTSIRYASGTSMSTSSVTVATTATVASATASVTAALLVASGLCSNLFAFELGAEITY